MTWAETIATGRSGGARVRVSIEGFGYEPVTHSDMEQTASDGRVRYAGLSFEGSKIIQRAELATAKLEAGGMSFKLADVMQRWTAAFSTRPTATTWLLTDTTASATTIEALSTASFPASGRIFIDSEVISYSGTTATEFTGCTRARWNTLGQAHYIPDGANQRFPAITNQPLSLEGRRVRIYAYGRGDSPTGDGTQIWLGVISREPRCQGATWSISADSIASILNQELGADLGAPASPRGIYIGAGKVVRLQFVRTTTGALITFGGTYSSHVDLYVHGFYETQQEWCDAINAAIAGSAMAGWNSSIRAEPSSDGRYMFRVMQSGTAEGVTLLFSGPPCEGEWGQGQPVDRLDRVTGILATNTEYFIKPLGGMDGYCTVPRGTFQYYADDWSVRDFGATSPIDRMYIGGGAAVSSVVDAALIKFGDAEEMHIVIDRNLADRYLDFRVGARRIPGVPAVGHAFTSTSLPEVRLGRNYDTAGDNGIAELLAKLVSLAPDDINRGAGPAIQATDYAGFSDLSFQSISALAKSRSYSSFTPVELGEIVSPELLLAGFFLAIDSSGRLTPSKFRLASPTEIGTFAITKSNLITDDGMPSYERGAAGRFNLLVLKADYDPIEDKYARQITVRDVSAFGLNPVGRAIKIEPKSLYVGSADENAEIVGVAWVLLGLLGGPYAFVSCVVPLTAFAAVIGTTVSMETALLPGSTGTRGVSALTGIIVGREIDLYAGRIDLTIMVSESRLSGYALTAKVASQSNVSGNTWDITLSSDYFASGDNAANHAVVGDRMRLWLYDSTALTFFNGTVVSATGNVVRVTLGGVWTPGVSEWVLGPAASDTPIEANQRLYCTLADADGTINYDTEIASAFELAP